MGALAKNTTASNNTAVGYQAGYNNVAGATNSVMLGTQAGYFITGGTHNIAIGYQSFYGTAGSTGASNVAVGSYTLYRNTTGSQNTVVGYDAMEFNTTGDNHVVMGYQSLKANTTGEFNTAIGTSALYSNTTASNNTAVGYQAGYSNTTGGNNTNIGYQAGYTNPSSGTNVFVGYQAGYAFNAVGQNSANAFIGYGAGSSVTSGLKNTILGSYNGNQGGLDIRTASNYIVLSDGDGNPLISTANSQTVALNGAIPNSGTGITFPATQNQSSNVNTLDDYEEGTWTPVIVTEGGSNFTITSSDCRYQKVGNKVYVQASITYSAKGSAALAYVSALPFYASVPANLYLVGYSPTPTANNLTDISLLHYANGNTVYFRASAIDTYYFTNIAFMANSGTLNFWGEYITSN